MLYVGNNQLLPKLGASSSCFMADAYYDSEIEYLESTGGRNHLINTRVSGGTDCEFELKFQLTTSTGNYPHMCGSVHPPTFPKILIAGGLKVQYKFTNNTSADIQLIASNDQNIHLLEFKNGIIYLDSQEVTTLEPSGFGNLPFCLFFYLAELGAATNGVGCRIFYCKLWKDHKLVRDLIPVRLKQTGYMYDKVTKQLFGNYFNKDFILGPESVQNNYTEIQYLESNGTQYIDTGIYINGETDRIELIYSGFTNKYFSCGCRQSHQNKAFVFSNGGTNWTTYSKYFLNYGTQSDFNITCSNNETIHRVIMDNNITVDGIVIKEFTKSNFTTDETFYLFAGNTNDSGIKYGHMRIYGFKLYRNNVLIKDFIPIKYKFNGYMLDRLSNQLLNNEGTGRFILGPDKPPLSYDAEIEYLESSGTQWIDTGIYPTNNTIAKIKFMNLQTTGDVIFGMYDGENHSYRVFNAQGYSSYFDTGDESSNGRLIASEIKIYPDVISVLELGNKYIKDINNDVTKTGTIYNTTYNKTITLNFYEAASPSGYKYSKNRWYYVQLYENATLVLDLIPVRVGQVGYMYDKVSGQYFGNAGTGDFILGPDKQEE